MSNGTVTTKHAFPLSGLIVLPRASTFTTKIGATTILPMDSTVLDAGKVPVHLSDYVWLRMLSLLNIITEIGGCEHE